MAITKLKTHDKCPVQIHKCKPGSIHYAALRCAVHSKHIQWLSFQEAQLVKELTQ